jgi:hypothetical protein
MNRRRVYNALCIHWDHHPSDATQHYGAGTRAEQIRSYLRTVKPDVTQYHTIGYLGYAGYPSSIAPVVPGLVGDPLQTWALACAAEGIPFGCYAASFSCHSPQPTPEWRCVNRAGVVSDVDYCSNGPWTEAFFIPLLLEVMERYHPVHFWLDGVWLPWQRENYCFCDYCQRKFQQQYGKPLPKAPQPLDWFDLQEFYEQSLDDAIGRIGRAIKTRDPKILMACNYRYFFKDARKPMPEVDWLSWDALNTPNLHQASFEATYISTAGQPADIMIYEQGIVRWEPQLLRRPRTLAQLQTEAGTILAHGARVNLWHDPNPDGSIASSKAMLARQVADFVRQRQDWCVDNNSTAEVAVLASHLDHCLNPQRQNVTIRAMQQLLQEAHIPCDVVRDDALLNRLVQYQLVILPETTVLDVDTAQWLHQYISDGGCVLIVVTDPADPAQRWQEALFGEEMSFTATDKVGDEAAWENELVQLGHRHYALSGAWQCVAPYQQAGTPWLAAHTLGDGSVLAITGEAISDYAETHWPPLRNLIAMAVRKGIGQLPLVEMKGHPGIELVMNRRSGDLYVHLVNLTPGISFGAPNEVFYDETPLYRGIELTVRPPRLPASIILLPSGEDLTEKIESSECQDPEGHCTLRIVVPELHHHVALKLTGALEQPAI